MARNHQQLSLFHFFLLTKIFFSHSEIIEIVQQMIKYN